MIPVHIYPDDDIIDHIDTCIQGKYLCPCDPDVEWDDEEQEIVVIHYPLDEM